MCCCYSFHFIFFCQFSDIPSVILPLITPYSFPFPPSAPGDAYYLAIGGGVAEHNWNHIRTVLQDQGFNCQLTDHSEDMGMISIQGPKRWGKEKEVERGGGGTLS